MIETAQKKYVLKSLFLWCAACLNVILLVFYVTCGPFTSPQRFLPKTFFKSLNRLKHFWIYAFASV